MKELSAAILGLVIILTAGLAFGLGCPYYNVWNAQMQGKASLARADQDREIKVREAIAERDASKLLGEARLERAKAASASEVVRAEGAAEANRIIADGLGGPEGYLRYLYIEGLKENSRSQIIYIPTEAGLPILEAGRPAGTQ